MKKTIYNTKLYVKRKRGLAKGLVRGLASMIVLSSAGGPMPRLRAEDTTKALRGDFVRIGMDMRKAAARVIENEKAAR